MSPLSRGIAATLTSFAFVLVADTPGAAEKEKADLGRTVIRCALVEAIEQRNAEGVKPMRQL